MADSNAAECKDRGLFGKKDEEKQSEQCQPQHAGHGDCGNKQQEGMVGKIKEKIPGFQDDKVSKEEPNKPGIMDKIKQKLPGNKEGQRDI